jgi:hypothetical protein
VPLLVAGALLGCRSEPKRNELDRNEVAQALASMEVRPGLWEVTSDIVSATEPGLPVEVAERMKGRRRAVRHCVTPEQAAQPSSSFIAVRRSGRCRDEAFEMAGGRISGAMVCRDGSGVESRVRTSGRYSPESYEMRMEMETPGILKGRVMTIVTREAGRRIGDCPAEGLQAGGEKKR